MTIFKDSGPSDQNTGLGGGGPDASGGPDKTGTSNVGAPDQTTSISDSGTFSGSAPGGGGGGVGLDTAGLGLGAGTGLDTTGGVYPGAGGGSFGGAGGSTLADLAAMSGGGGALGSIGGAGGLGPLAAMAASGGFSAGPGGGGFYGGAFPGGFGGVAGGGGGVGLADPAIWGPQALAGGPADPATQANWANFGGPQVPPQTTAPGGAESGAPTEGNWLSKLANAARGLSFTGTAEAAEAGKGDTLNQQDVQDPGYMRQGLGFAPGDQYGPYNPGFDPQTGNWVPPTRFDLDPQMRGEPTPGDPTGYTPPSPTASAGDILGMTGPGMIDPTSRNYQLNALRGAMGGAASGDGAPSGVGGIETVGGPPASQTFNQNQRGTARGDDPNQGAVNPYGDTGGEAAGMNIGADFVPNFMGPPTTFQTPTSQAPFAGGGFNASNPPIESRAGPNAVSGAPASQTFNQNQRGTARGDDPNQGAVNPYGDTGGEGAPLGIADAPGTYNPNFLNAPSGRFQQPGTTAPFAGGGFNVPPDQAQPDTSPPVTPDTTSPPTPEQQQRQQQAPAVRALADTLGLSSEVPGIGSSTYQQRSPPNPPGGPISGPLRGLISQMMGGTSLHSIVANALGANPNNPNDPANSLPNLVSSLLLQGGVPAAMIMAGMGRQRPTNVGMVSGPAAMSGSRIPSSVRNLTPGPGLAGWAPALAIGQGLDMQGRPSAAARGAGQPGGPAATPLTTPDEPLDAQGRTTPGEWASGAPQGGAPRPGSAPEETEGTTPTGAEGDPYIRSVFSIESNNDPNNITKNNYGLGQFSFGEYGITPQNWRDPRAQARAMQMEIADKGPKLRRALGHEPSPAEMYIAHQQGLPGGISLLRAAQQNPNMPAWQAIAPNYRRPDIAGTAISNNLTDDLKGIPLQNITAGQFVRSWTARFNRAYSPSPIKAADRFNRPPNTQIARTTVYEGQAGLDAARAAAGL